MPIRRIIVFIILLLQTFLLSAQILKFNIKNQPKNQPIIIGELKGDRFNPIDTININHIQLSPEFAIGVYQAILGKTIVAEVLNEPPQQFDFIYNHEDIQIKTDFNAPFDSLKVVKSEENKVWYSFIKEEKAFQEKLKYAKMELDYSQSGSANSNSPDNMRLETRITRYNSLQKQRDSLISQAINNNPNLYATKLIRMYHEPFLNGNLTKEKRDSIFKSEYLAMLDFSDESLMHSTVYTDKVFKYLMAYAEKGLSREQQIGEFKKAIDQILTYAFVNQKVYEFVMDYLVRGFEKLQLEELIEYIASNYSETTCQTDEKTTLERKLASQKMKTGTALADFEMPDINGDPFLLSTIQKPKILIVFWASWCPHCVELLPKIKEWQKQQQKELEIIAVSIDTSKTEWKNKVYEMGIDSWYNLSDQKGWDGKMTTDYNIYATPTMFLIDDERKIIAKPITLEELLSYFTQ